MRLRPVLTDPGRTELIRPYDGSARPPPATQRRLLARRNFGAEWQGLGASCLRFARWVTRTGRQTRFRLLAKLYRVGLVTHRVPMKGFNSCIPPSQVSWRRLRPLFAPLSVLSDGKG
jgi:hypothetical protein